jgi:hypothetical protein
MNKPLTRDQANEIMRSLEELHALNNLKIVAKGDDEKRSALTTFITQAMFSHAPELMGVWVAFKAEYEPLIVGFAGMLGRASNVLQSREEKKGD